MSGIKQTTTTINVQELNRLRREASRASSLANANAALQRLQQRNETCLSQHQARINSLNSSISTLNERLRKQSEESNAEANQLRAQIQEAVARSDQALHDMSRRHQESLAGLEQNFADQINQGRIDTVRMIETNNRYITDALNRAMDDMNTRLGSVDQRIDDVENAVRTNAYAIGRIVDSDRALLEDAREFVNSAHLVFSDTEANFRTELLIPGRRDQLREIIACARHEIELCDKQPTNASVARSSSRAALSAALQFRQDAVHAEQEWVNRYRAANQAVDTADAQRIASEHIDVVINDENVSLDTDYWSNGDMSAAGERIAALQRRLRDPSTLSIEDLEGIRKAGIQLVSEIIESAGFAAIACSVSQDRADCAQTLADELFETLGLVLVQHGYQGDDERAAHRVRLTNPVTGFDMVITQTPELQPDGSLVNRLESDILDFGTNNQEEGDRIAYQALSELREFGFVQTEVQTARGFENTVSNRRERADIAEWQRAQPAVPSRNRQSKEDAGSDSGGSCQTAM